MNNPTGDLDQAEEEMLTRTASDEELERTGTDMALPTYTLPNAWCCP